MRNFICLSNKTLIRVLRWTALSILLTASDSHAELSNSIVTIYCTTSAGSSQGTGFVFGSEGLIVTAYHVIQDSTSIVVRDAAFREISVLVSRIDPKHDVAILETSDDVDSGLRPVGTLPNSQIEVRVGGSPRGLPKQVLFGRLTSAGTISSLKISDESGHAIFSHDIDVYPVDITVYSGMSGAPVVGSNDAVIGVFSGSYAEGRGIGWAIPIKYITALLLQPALHRSASSMGSWPSLDLMGSRWISLKRSYDKPFDSEHIAQLEILEEAAKVMAGAWKAHQDHRSTEVVLYGGCEKISAEQRTLTFDRVDQSKAVLVGRYRRTYSQRGDWSAPAYPPPEIITVESQRSFCNIAAMGDQNISHGELQLEGTVLLSVDDIEDFGDNKKFSVVTNVEDCAGTLCEAKMYGKHSTEPIEMISPERLRAGEFIFAKVQP
jgi:hypothetical protein